MQIPVYVELDGRAGGHDFVVDLDPASLDQASTWCGSYDILEMGQHFDNYVMTPRPLLLPLIPGFPAGRRYIALPGKLQAPSVQGNIGESVAAMTAGPVFGCDCGDIAHIRPGGGRSAYKAPDLLFRVKSQLRELASDLTGLGAIEMPEWIPCEAKCRRFPTGVRAAIREAREQLAEFWDQLVEEERGFGIACCFIHQPPQQVQVRLFLPPVSRQDVGGIIE